MNSKIKRFFMPAAAICTAVMMMGIEECDSEEASNTIDELLQTEVEPTKAAPSVHEIVKYPHGDETEQVVPSYFGADVTVRKLGLLYYKEITAITAVPRPNEPGFFDIKIKLTSRGRKMWIGLSVPNQRTQLAFLIDGMYYRSFHPRMIYDDVTDEVMVDGPFDQATAMELQTEAPKNYKKGKRKK